MKYSVRIYCKTCTLFNNERRLIDYELQIILHELLFEPNHNVTSPNFGNIQNPPNRYQTLV